MAQVSSSVVSEASGTGRLLRPVERFTEISSRQLGPFVLVEQLGRGGFAPVWLARETYGETTLRTAAVKLFSLPRAGGAAERERGRIIAEARALCRVEHPNVVRFYALPIDEEHSVMGLAMEHVAGVPLDRRLQKQGRLEPTEVLALGAAVASALAAVHRAGLVHRDVKPSNIVEAAGVYKLIDFGIAGADSDAAEAEEAPAAASEQTQRVAIMVGTVGYIDPECVALRLSAEPTSDLYALGATLFACLSGTLPASNSEGLRPDVLDGRARPPKITDLAPETPRALADLIDALIAPRRAERPSSAEWVAIRIEQIRRELGGSARRLPPESVGPFRGLGRFEAEDREVYFGRSGEVAAALETLRGRGAVALLGPSGSGKSSLVRAGLLPAVAEGALGEHPSAWDIVVTAPGNDARAAVLHALSPLLPEAAELTPSALIARLAQRVHSSDRGLLLFVDQLEELATLSAPESASYVVELLREIGERPLLGVRAVLAARRDQLDPLLALTDLGKVVLRGSVLVEPLTDSVWGEVVDRALGAYGYEFEDSELRAEVLAELGRTSDAMPLVQFALTELWHRRDSRNRRITRQGVHSVGGVAGALERHAEASAARILADASIPESALRKLLLSLTTPRGTRATRSVSELTRAVGPIAGSLSSMLEAERLLVHQAGGLTLAHEALISSWRLLREALNEERERRLLAESLEEAAAVWARDRDHAPLWRGLRLESGEQLAGASDLTLSEEAESFLAASRRSARRQRLLVASVAMAVLVSGGIVTGSYLRAVRAEQQKTSAALSQEQASRRLAEQRAHEVEAAQARIDRLLQDLADSPKKEQVLDLQRSIRAASAPLEAPVRPARGREPEPPARVASAPAPVPSATPSTLKIQREW